MHQYTAHQLPISCQHKHLKSKSTIHVVCLSILGKKKLALVDGKVSDPWVGEMPWRRKWLPSPVFWPGESHGLYIP